jgi:hypothetical protein
MNKTQCYIACGLAASFFGGMLYITLNPYKYDVLQNYLDLLDEKQKLIFNQVHRERMQIYLMGLVLGLLLGFIYLQSRGPSVSRTCAFVAIVMGVNYLFYMIYPKSVYMIRHLETPEQVNAHQTVYRTMQYRQYMGMALGLVAYVLVSIV